MAKATEKDTDRVPLCVDLDGTLLRTDMLVESFLRLIKKQPWTIFLLPVWLVRGGKANLKRQIARRVEIKFNLLPYNTEVVEHLRDVQKNGRKVVLATASDKLLATPIASHLGFFADTLASDGDRNLSGNEKAKILTEKYGENGYDYIGDHRKDIPVWKQARKALLVESHNELKSLLEKQNIAIGKIFPNRDTVVSRLKLYIKAIRLHQWAKNALIFVPLLTSHSYTSSTLILNTLIAFVSFGLLASSVYLVNDLLDLESDRAHPKKSKRPFASGDIPLTHGLILAPALIVIGLMVSLIFLPANFTLAVLVYLVITTAYSFFLKRKFGVDVITLASLYTMRIFAGAAAIGVIVSDWLLGFSMFFFMSLALVKRYSELYGLADRDGRKTTGRGYFINDLPLVGNLGVSSGMVSILVLVLYLKEQIIQGLFSTPVLMWLLCPLIAHWLIRIWLLAYRGEMDEDPVVFAVKDGQSQIVAVFILFIITFSV